MLTVHLSKGLLLSLESKSLAQWIREYSTALLGIGTISSLH